MPTHPLVSKVRPVVPFLFLAALFVAAGGAIHLREWLDIYRNIPDAIPGAAVVRVGFVVNAAVSAVLALALVATSLAGKRLTLAVVGASAAFQAASLASLFQSRSGSLFGWMETGWTPGATQILAAEIGALVTLAAVAGLATIRPPQLALA